MPETDIVIEPGTVHPAVSYLVAGLAVYGAGSVIKDVTKLGRKFKARRDLKTEQAIAAE